MARSGVKADGAQHERQGDDWYVEPEWCTELLLDRISFADEVFDPAMGRGNIVRVCKRYGLGATGSDLVHRGSPFFVGVRDFLNGPAIYACNIITNPPYKLAEAFIRRSLGIIPGKLAVLTRLEFLASQKRNAFFDEHPPTKILVLSRRPSMPPGELYNPDKEARGGTLDYCWIVWDKQSDEPTTVEWLL